MHAKYASIYDLWFCRISIHGQNSEELCLPPQGSGDQTPGNMPSTLMDCRICFDTRLTGSRESQSGIQLDSPGRDSLTIEPVDLGNLPTFVIAS